MLDPSLLTSNDLNRPSTLQLIVDSLYLGSLLSCICQSFSCAIVFFFSNSAGGFMRHCYFSYIIFTGSWINSFLASACHFSYCLFYLGIGFKHLYPQFVCCSKFEWSMWHSCVWRKRVGAWAGATAQPQCSTGRCSLEWRPRGCVAVGRSQLVARGRRGNMLPVKFELQPTRLIWDTYDGNGSVSTLFKC